MMKVDRLLTSMINHNQSDCRHIYNKRLRIKQFKDKTTKNRTLMTETRDFHDSQLFLIVRKIATEPHHFM